jgi:phosphonate transport system substrate-binding protein
MADTVRFTSSQAPNADSYVRAILTHIGAKTDIPIQWEHEDDWLARENALDQGRNQIGWVCGLPYVWKADDPNIQIELLAAPVMAAPRYQSKAIYFSDVIVKHDSPYQSFLDLRGASWAINEVRSQSGFNITRYHLAELGELSNFFGHVEESGSHQLAIRRILRGKIDAAAIDSTVLETEFRLHPEFQEKLKIIEILGPSPIPPWIVHQSLDKQQKMAIQTALLNLHTYPEGQKLLAEGALSHFADVNDEDYDPIRKMEEAAQSVKLL